MISYCDLKFGDKIFVVDIKNNAFFNKKIFMVDDDGVEWYRYEKPHYEYTIITIEYCGKVSYIEEGIVAQNDLRHTEYHFKYPDGHIHYKYEEDLDDVEIWFHSENEAHQYILEHQKGH
jgi:hypothetical protein